MFPVQMWGWNGGDEELGTVGVWTRISHGQETNIVMFDYEVFVGEFLTINRFSASTIMCCEISTLEHEVWDDPVESASFVAISVLTSAKFSEVSSSLWDLLIKEVEGNSSSILAIDGDIKKASFVLLCHFFVFVLFYFLNLNFEFEFYKNKY